jgi:hypothetical protein
MSGPHRARAGYPYKRQVTLGVLLYLFPSALNAGWLALASMLGIMQVGGEMKLQHGVWRCFLG